MKNIFKIIKIIIATTILTTILLKVANDGVNKRIEKIKLNSVQISSDFKPIDIPVPTTEAEPVVQIDFPYYKSVPLDKKLQKYIYELSLQYDIPVTLAYGLMYVESNFDKDAYSETKDSGLTQINHRTGKWIAKELGYNEYDLHDPKTNVEFAFWYLNYLKEYWTEQDVSEEDKAFLVVLSYHRGIEGAIEWVKKYGFNSKYVDKVFEYKEMLEREVSE